MFSAVSISDQISHGSQAAAAILEETLDRVSKSNDRLNAFLSLCPDRARQKAADIDYRMARAQTVGCLAGVPVALKDNICTDWGLTTCGSRMLADYRSPFSAHVVEKLEAADAVIIGKTNLDEFAMGSSTENSAFGVTRNPWDLDRVAGGSSGGSVAAVAAGLVPLALGSETGGSVRQPASFCGVVGLKPSYGRISRYGLVAFGSSLDQIGLVGKDVRDVALLLGVIAGPDGRDSTCVNQGIPDYVAALGQPAGPPLRIGYSPEYFGEGLDIRVRDVVLSAIREYEQRGARIVEVHMPHLKYSIACYYLICTAEASSNLARFDGIHYGQRSRAASELIDVYEASRAEGFGSEVKRRIMLGTYALSSGYYDAYYLKALKVRTLLKRDFDRAFEQVDVIASPVSPVPAFRIGERTSDPLAMYLADIYTASANLAGICALSLPCGFTVDGLPVGLQLQAPAFAEDKLLRIACGYEEWTDWQTRHPPDFRTEGNSP